MPGGNSERVTPWTPRPLGSGKPVASLLVIRSPAPGSLGLGCGPGRSWRFLLPVLPRVALDAARRVHQPLLAGEERMAVGTDLESQLLTFRRARGPRCAARAVDVHVHVFRMYSRFHGNPRKLRIL